MSHPRHQGHLAHLSTILPLAIACMVLAPASSRAAPAGAKPVPKLLLEPMRIGDHIEATSPRVRPVFSPNGRYVAFVEVAQDRQVLVVVEEPSRTVMVRAGLERDVVVGWPTWSPDSRWVGFGTENGSLAYVSTEGVYSTWQVPFYGKPKTVIWQPIAGQRLIVLTDRGALSVGISGSRAPRRLNLGKADQCPTSLSLTADGRRLAYCLEGEVWITTSPDNPGNIVAKAEDPLTRLDRVWISPDGSRVLAAGPDKEDEGRDRLLMVNIVAGTAVLLDVVGRISSAAWSNDAGRIAVAADGKILLFRGDGKALGKLLDDECVDRDPCWDRDSKRIVFSSVRRDADRNDKVDARDPPDIYLIDVPEGADG